MKELMKRMKCELSKVVDEIDCFIAEEDGMGTVELILILVVLIGLVIIFKKQMRELVNSIFEKITKDSNTIMS